MDGTYFYANGDIYIGNGKITKLRDGESRVKETGRSLGFFRREN